MSRLKEKSAAGIMFRFGVPASVMAVFLTALFLFSSCGDGDDGGSVTKSMDGYFLTQNDEGAISCLAEDVNVTLTGIEGGYAVESDSSFPTYDIKNTGYIAENVNPGGDNTEIYVLTYISVDKETGAARNPGVYYLQAASDDGEDFIGFWVGKPNMPRDGIEGIICPYYLEEDKQDNLSECPDDIKSRLGDRCYRTNANGFVNPVPVM